MLPCRASATDVRILRVLSKIKQAPAVNIQELALLVKLSRSRLGHLFKTETGVELRHFLLDSRLDKAAALLRDTDMQVKEISHTIGYHHVPSFDRVFRRKFNASPADYRRQRALDDFEFLETIVSSHAIAENSNENGEKG